MSNVSCVLKEVCIKNFKSFKNLKIRLKKFNVVVGPNASGKTNFIEFFKFLKKSLVEVQRPYVPYIEWWSYRNIVWEGKEELPIEAVLKFKIDGYDVEYQVSFGGVGGFFRILYERLQIDKKVLLEREGQVLRIRHTAEFIKENMKKVNVIIKRINEFLPITSKFKREFTSKDLSEQILKLPGEFSNLLHLETLFLPFSTRFKDLRPTLISPRISPEEDIGVIILPVRKRTRFPFLTIINELNAAIGDFTILRHPNMKEIKSPSLPKKENILLEDSTNLYNILYSWFTEKRKLPERIERALIELFPDIQIGFKLTHEGKVFMQIYEKGVELDPPCIPDGLYKVLTILTAIELKPSLLAIDEIENSLYAEALEYIIDELKASESIVIITTHSPLVVDMIDLEDLLIAEKTGEGTVLKRVKNPEKVREKLSELKITQSESWLYGELTK